MAGGIWHQFEVPGWFRHSSIHYVVFSHFCGALNTGVWLTSLPISGREKLGTVLGVDESEVFGFLSLDSTVLSASLGGDFRDVVSEDHIFELLLARGGIGGAVISHDRSGPSGSRAVGGGVCCGDDGVDFVGPEMLACHIFVNGIWRCHFLGSGDSLFAVFVLACTLFDSGARKGAM